MLRGGLQDTRRCRLLKARVMIQKYDNNIIASQILYKIMI